MKVDRDDHGFLVDPEDWDRDVALYLAAEENIQLKEEHWNIIHTIRELYANTGTVPELRTILKNLRQTIGADKATRKYVYTLFPYGYGQQACKIAGMRLPRKLWLDV